jgi:hypothetical protein
MLILDGKIAISAEVNAQIFPSRHPGLKMGGS